MNAYDILQSPLLSEKAYAGFADGKYTFWVHPQATKTQVAAAVEKAFSVKVTAVNTQTLRGKTKRVGRFSGQKSDRKKAVVTLADGQKIEALEGLV